MIKTGLQAGEQMGEMLLRRAKMVKGRFRLMPPSQNHLGKPSGGRVLQARTCSYLFQ